jgi:hypothetical protein
MLYQYQFTVVTIAFRVNNTLQLQKIFKVFNHTKALFKGVQYLRKRLHKCQLLNELSKKATIGEAFLENL